jgi:hypothetical protein
MLIRVLLLVVLNTAPAAEVADTEVCVYGALPRA